MSQPLNSIALQLNCQQSIAQRVVTEDRRKRRRNHHLNAPFHHGPYGVFSGGSTAKIKTGQQNGGALIAHLIEHEIGISHPRIRVAVTPGRKQPIGKARARHRPHLSRRDNRVGIDIIPQKRCGDPVMQRERCHGLKSANKCPAQALAATLSGLPRCVLTPKP